MTIEVEVKDKEFAILGEDEPGVVVKQIHLTDAGQHWDHWLDPDEADALVDKLITALYDVDFYTDPFKDSGETQEED